jgi:hypothetical protein
MKQFLAIIVIIPILVGSCKLSQSQLKERAKPAIIQYFQLKHPGIIVDTLNIIKVERVKEGWAAYKVYYAIKTTDTTNKKMQIRIQILPKANDFVLLTKDFDAIVK